MPSDLRRFFRRLTSRFGPALQSDTAFIEEAYREVLGRPADQDGMNHYRLALSHGLGRTAVILDLARSDEFTRKLSRSTPSLPSLIAQRPDRYREAIDRTNGQRIRVYNVSAPADIDWLETAILENRYYEQPGVWTLGVDVDKRVMSEMVASFAPRRALELGCAAGAVLDCLQDLNVTAEGVEISAMAIARASDRIRPRIHHGDLLNLDLARDYDLTFGFDIFEHLNPNRLAAYLQRLSDITVDDGFLFVNVPAFGADSIFGTVFPRYIESWDADAVAGRAFSDFHVDELGYPLHGHLVWAEASWWVQQFEAHGFIREVEIERELHCKYDDHLKRRSPARVAFFVFAKQPDAARRREVLARIGHASQVLS